jgi:tRNA nucleotidyltransferase/poly(A) polymerase
MDAVELDQPSGDAVARVIDAFMAARTPVYIVGGAVRDHLLGISAIPGWTPAKQDGKPRAGAGAPASTTDLDLVLNGPVLPLAKRVADSLGWAYYPLDEARDVARIIGRGGDGRRIECDAAALRGDLRSDLLARDFSVNALALELSANGPARLIDLCGGIADITSGTLRRISDESLHDDPIRLLRAVRLAAQLGFTIENETRRQIVDLAGTVLRVSAERLRQELWKLLDCSRPDHGIRELNAFGLLDRLLPEVSALQGVTQSSRHHLDAYDHSLLTARRAAELRDWLRGGSPLEDDKLKGALEPWAEPLRAHFGEEIAAGHDRAGWLVWHALLHDTGKAAECAADSSDGAERRSRAGHQQLSAQLAGRRVAQLRFSRREVLLAGRVASMHSVPRNLVDSLPRVEKRIDRRTAYRFFRDAGSVTAGRRIERHLQSSGARQPLDGLDVTLQAISDLHATGLERGAEWGCFLKAVEGLFSFAFSRQADYPAAPLVDGHALMRRLGLEPGPTLGAVIRELSEAQAAGAVANADEAVALARELLARGVK